MGGPAYTAARTGGEEEWSRPVQYAWRCPPSRRAYEKAYREEDATGKYSVGCYYVAVLSVLLKTSLSRNLCE